jgi:hypothetical protein
MAAGYIALTVDSYRKTEARTFEDGRKNPSSVSSCPEHRSPALVGNSIYPVQGRYGLESGALCSLGTS